MLVKMHCMCRVCIQCISYLKWNHPGFDVQSFWIDAIYYPSESYYDMLRKKTWLPGKTQPHLPWTTVTFKRKGDGGFEPIHKQSSQASEGGGAFLSTAQPGARYSTVEELKIELVFKLLIVINNYIGSLLSHHISMKHCLKLGMISDI